MGLTYLSRQGHQDLLKRVEEMKKQKRQLSREVGTAREHGDLRENAEYHAAKERLAQVVGQLGDLEMKLTQVQITDDLEMSTDEALLGMKVTVKDPALGIEETYVLVGPDEVDPANGKISIASPLGKGLLGHKVGERVKIQLPKAVVTFELLTIERA